MFINKRLPRHRMLLVAGVVTVLTLLACAAVAVAWVPGEKRHARSSGSSIPAPRPSPGGSPVVGEPAAREFATDAAKKVFGWDTTTATSPDGYLAGIMSIADPDGTEANGLIVDVRTYLPTYESWVELRTYRTRQWLEVTAVDVPSTWAAATDAGDAYGLEPGTAAYTISGIRHRSGIWNDERVSSRNDVTFTAFINCSPRGAACHLLRLSRLDSPLP